MTIGEDFVDLIVLDLEWNQAPDLETKLESSLEFEILEIGAVRLDEKKQQTGSFHELIRPQVFHEMNQITGELIHLELDQLRDCRTFSQVAADFLDWCGRDHMFCTWGSMDLWELQKNMDYYRMAPLSDKPFRFYDVQKLYSIAFEDRRSRRTLQHAVEALGIRTDVAFHRAYADAYYTARVLQRIEDPRVFSYHSFDTYRLPQDKAEEIRVRFGDYTKYITRGFPDKQAAMRDREVLSTRCAFCRNKTSVRIPWFTNNGKNYYALVSCPSHGPMKGKIRLRRSESGRIYVVKTMKKAGPEVVADVMDKKDQIRERRKMKRRNASF